MSKVVPIHRGRFLGAYHYAQSIKRTPYEVFFLTGALLSIGLPQFVFGVYGGAVVLTTVTGSTLLGLLWGLWRYYRGQGRQASCVDAGHAAQSPPHAHATERDAARRA